MHLNAKGQNCSVLHGNISRDFKKPKFVDEFGSEKKPSY